MGAALDDVEKTALGIVLERGVVGGEERNCARSANWGSGGGNFESLIIPRTLIPMRGDAMRSKNLPAILSAFVLLVTAAIRRGRRRTVVLFQTFRRSDVERIDLGHCPRK